MSYIGEKEILEINGNEVKFIDGTSKVYTEKSLKYLVTEEAKDLSQLQSLMLDNVVTDILVIFNEHDIKKSDIGAILNTVVSSFNEAFNEAVGKAFGTYEKDIHSAYYVDNIRMSDVMRLKNI